MESYIINNLTFKYPSSSQYALNGVSIEIMQGEFCVICGASGCGKSTLLRLLKPVLSPRGTIGGEILLEGERLENLSHRAQTEKIGFVMQSPENQIVTDKVWHELAFGLESLGVKNSEIRSRVAEMASFFGIEDWFHKKTCDLSGGQKQLLNLASVMVMQPSVLILDEPTSQLDPIASRELLEAVAKINRELGVTVILSEHRLEEALAFADKVVVMEKGSIVCCESPRNVAHKLKEGQSFILNSMPVAMRVFASAQNGEENPVTVREGRMWLKEYKKGVNLKKINTTPPSISDEIVLSIEDVYFRYEKESENVVKALSACIHKGELYAILGGNGSGKTTTLSLLASLNKPYRGKITFADKNAVIGVLPQNPQTLFVEKTVEKDLWEMLNDLRLPKSEKQWLLNECITLCELEEIIHRHPYDISGGEMQRAALAKVLLRKPEILLLDEPTKGMDAQFKAKFATILRTLQNEGVTVIMVSHDVEFCAKYATRCAMFFDGSIVSEDSPGKFFAGKSFYTTAANRMARGIIESAVTAEDIIYALGGEEIKADPPKKKSGIYSISKAADKPTEKKISEECSNTPKKSITKAHIAGIVSTAILMPLTAFAGLYLLGDRKFYFISLLLIIEAIIPFLFFFEKRKPSSREIVVISVICALGVAGRIVFFMLPQFKPMAAIVIIAGVVYGAETGFLTGAVSAFVSNFYFGQGPWTPWQMFALAAVGFLSGFLFRSGMLKKTRMSLCIFGIIAATFVYGLIVDLSALSYVGNPDFKAIATVWSLGLAFNIIHGFSTGFFLYVCGGAMIEKLERIKEKYGILA